MKSPIVYELIAAAIGVGIGFMGMCVGVNLWPALAVVFVVSVAYGVALNTYLPMKHERQVKARRILMLRENNPGETECSSAYS